MLKDLTLASVEHRSKTELKLLNLVRKSYKKADEMGLSGQDYSRIIDAIAPEA
jgi:3-hydroxyisobutyrate dehydrogenase-like beta-hydroxyacid dehydrogenase